jgi:hypothetical protein
MDRISRETFQSRLRGDWQNYVERYNQLAPAEQQAFLKKQGYTRLGDLLGHVIAWWQDGAQMIAKMRTDPTYPLGDYDVDAFNAQAVERFRPCSDAEIIRLFLTQQQAMFSLVNSLSDEELAQENINTRLYYEIIMHWLEHELKS